MLRWLIKTLYLQKGSVISSSLGVSAAFILVILLDAVFVGESKQIVAYLRHANADIWVMQKGVSNMHMASSFVWDWKADQIATLDGVDRVTPILYMNTAIKTGQKNWFSYVIGLEDNAIRAGPWAMSQGKRHPGEGEIILPQVMSDLTGIKIGDTAMIADKTFSIVGFSKDTFSMANSIAFVSFSDLEDLLEISGSVSFILVDITEGSNPAKLALQIEQQIDKVTALPQAQFIRNDYQIALLMGVEIISFMSLIGTVLAIMIIAFASYSLLRRRKRELAVLKALGINNISLYMAIILQSLIMTGMSLLITVLLAWSLLPLLSALVPQLTLEVTADAMLRLFSIGFIVALLAAIIPAHLVARVDPLTVFKV